MHINRCRICDSSPLDLLLDLGETALANRFIPPAQAVDDEPRFPLRLVLCQRCGLVQIDETIPPEELFSNYIYVTGTSDQVWEHASRLAARLVDKCDLQPHDLVVEVASNDGTVLKAFEAHRVKAVGVEPAANIAAAANAAGVETISRFFGRQCAADIRGEFGPAQLVLARHVLAHAAELNDFVAGLATMVDDGGLVVVEVPHLLKLHENLEYDTIYHEHLCYFSVRTLRSLFDRHGLELVEVREEAIHGGSIVVAAQRRGGAYPVDPSVRQLITREERAALHRLPAWQKFARAVEAARRSLLAELERMCASGRRLAGYGAPAKGMTLLAYCGIGPDRLRYLVDRCPRKQGLLTSGSHIPVFGAQRLLDDQPDVVLLLAWNFAPEILRQQFTYLRRGGRFLIPIPGPHYADGTSLVKPAERMCRAV